jgi:hypothetical protein
VKEYWLGLGTTPESPDVLPYTSTKLVARFAEAGHAALQVGGGMRRVWRQS